MIALVMLLCFSPFLCASSEKQFVHDPSIRIIPLPELQDTLQETKSKFKVDDYKELMEKHIPEMSKKLAYSLICNDLNSLFLIKSGVGKKSLFTQYPDFVMPLAAKYVSEKFLAIHNESDPSRKINTDHKQVLSLLEKMGFINENRELYQDIIDGLRAGVSDPDIVEMMENVNMSSDEE